VNDLEKRQVTDKDGAKYIKSRGSGYLANKWHKISPGFKKMTEAEDKAKIVDTPPKHLMEEKVQYCQLIKE